LEEHENSVSAGRTMEEIVRDWKNPKKSREKQAFSSNRDSSGAPVRFLTNRFSSK